MTIPIDRRGVLKLALLATAAPVVAQKSFFVPKLSLATASRKTHFAGEHISRFQGWMQGALQSGLRAAKEVIV
jgi:monoamine oxidase